MNDTVIVALLGIAGTLLAPFISQLSDNNKAKNERKLHAQKVRFDLEFELYQTLVEKHLTMVYDVGAAVLIANGQRHPTFGTNEEFVSRAAEHINEADIQNKRSAPFISKEIFDTYKNLGKLSHKAIALFNLFCSFDKVCLQQILFNEKPYTRNQAKHELEAMQKEISDLSDAVLDQVRDYLNNNAKK